MAKPQAKTLQERMGFTDPELKTPGHDALMLWLDDQMTSTQLQVWLHRDGWDKRNVAGVQKRIDDDLRRIVKEYESRLRETENHKQKTIERIVSYQDAIDGIQPYVNERVTPDLLREWLNVAKADLLDIISQVDKDTQALAMARHKAIAPDMPVWPGVTLTQKQWEMPVMSRSYTVGFIDFVVSYQEPCLYATHQTGTDWPHWGVEMLDRQVFFEVKTTIPSLGELLRQLGQYRQYLNNNDWHVNPPIFVVSPDARFAEKIHEQGFGFIQAPAHLSLPAETPPSLIGRTPKALTDAVIETCRHCHGVRLENWPGGRLVCLDCLGVPLDYVLPRERVKAAQ